MITGTVRVDLTAEPGQTSRDRRLLDVLAACPDGAHVVVDIGSRNRVTQDAAAWLHGHDARLRIEVIGTDPAGVATFVRAAREGVWSVVA